MRNLDAGRAKRILLLQAATTLSLAVIAVAFGPAVGLSALIGGATATVANALFTVLVFGGYRAQEAGRLALRLYAAEVLKLLVIVAAFSAAFILVPSLSL